MRIFVVVFFLFFMGLAGHTFAAGMKSCSEDDAIAAEEEASTLKDWNSVYKSFKRFWQCDDGAISEGYSNSVAGLLANDWASIGDFELLATKDRNFKKFVLYHIDELMELEQAQQIYVNVRTHCPMNMKKLCKLIENELDKTPTGETP